MNPHKNQLPSDVLMSHDIIILTLLMLHPLRCYHFTPICLHLHFFTPRHTLHSLICVLF